MRVHPAWMLPLILMFLWVGFPATTCAEEQWQPFLESLRASDYHDMAKLYLDRMAARPDCPPDLKEVLDYQRGITLKDQPTVSRSEWKENFAEARKLLERFCEQHPRHKDAIKARTQLVNVLFKLGRRLVNESKEIDATPEEKKKLLADARNFYSQARKVLEDQNRCLTAELESLSGSGNAAKERPLKLLQCETQLYLAMTDFYIGLTYPSGSNQRTSLIRGAAKQYNDLYNERKDEIAGLCARMWEGRCYQKLGDPKQAIEMLDSVLLQLDNTPPSRTLKNIATAWLIETMIDPKVKRYADAINMYKQWEKVRNSTEASSSEGVEISYLAGVASLDWAKSLDASDKRRIVLLADAKKAFRFVLQHPGEFRSRARKALKDELLATGEEQEKREPRDFAEAMEFGHDERDRINLAKLRYRGGKGKISLEEFEEITQDSERKAISYFEKALRLATPDTSIKEVNQARYFLAYFLSRQGRFYEAAALADYLARRFSADGEVGRPAARLALSIFVDMEVKMKAAPEASPEEKAAEKAFANRHADEMARYIITMWPESSEATDAKGVLIHTALRKKQIKEAVDIFNTIPPDAEGRGPLLLIAGRVLYSEYVRLLNQREEATKDSTGEKPKVEQTEPDWLLNQSKAMLEEGLKLAKENGMSEAKKVDRSFLAGELTLARIYLIEKDEKKAIELVDNEHTGLLAIVNKLDPDSEVIRDGLDIEAYKTSLRILVPVENGKLAFEVMESLEKRIKKNGQKNDRTQITRIYLGLVQELKRNFDRLQKEGKTEEAAAVQANFEKVLDQVSVDAESNNFNVMYWLAATYSDLAESPGSDVSRPLSPKARQYCEKSLQIYDKILKRCEADKSFASSTEVIDSIRLRMAVGLRRLGRYEDALKQLYAVLKDRNTMVDAQVEAAKTYEAWAGTKGNAKLYLNAMLGGVPREENGQRVYVFWGWGMLSKRLAGNDKYRELFHEARYRFLMCRYKYATSGVCKDPEKYFKDIVQDIRFLRKFYPEMGGPAMKQKYKQLYNKIPAKYK